MNHKQRLESDTEEACCENGQRAQIPIYVAYFSGTFSETAARDFRYKF